MPVGPSEWTPHTFHELYRFRGSGTHVNGLDRWINCTLDLDSNHLNLGHCTKQLCGTYVRGWPHSPTAKVTPCAIRAGDEDPKKAIERYN